ncbi:MAG TPA: hypothetical protein VMV04_00660 [Thermodesulfobacteriota bacterium]|nr:hypothetical protein [Thermodesulfobacteriota bacterium]
MNRYWLKWVVGATAVTIALCAILSILFSVPYIYTIAGLAGLIFAGHLITIDDDMPGEWSNPEGSKKIWRSSMLELLVKFLVAAAILTLAVVFPKLTELGA